MIFDTYIPCSPLNEFILHFSYFKFDKVEHRIDRFLPDGNIEIIINLTDYPKFIYDNITLKEIQECKEIWLSGIRTKYISISSRNASEMFVVHFKKGKVYPFIQIPVYEITDNVIEAELLLTKQIKNLREKLLSINSIIDKFHYVENYFLSHYAKKLTVNPFTEYAVSEILQKPESLTIEKLSRKIGYSQKHMIAIFKDHVGVAPKAFLKIIRFQKAIGELESYRTVNWAQFAYERGYFDQAHFISDFKRFSGFTPQEYLKHKSETLNYVPII